METHSSHIVQEFGLHNVPSFAAPSSSVRNNALLAEVGSRGHEVPLWEVDLSSYGMVPLRHIIAAAWHIQRFARFPSVWIVADLEVPPRWLPGWHGCAAGCFPQSIILGSIQRFKSSARVRNRSRSEKYGYWRAHPRKRAHVDGQRGSGYAAAVCAVGRTTVERAAFRMWSRTVRLVLRAHRRR